MDFRTKKLLTHVDRAGTGLEIGPSYNPVTPKAAGWNVKIADHLNAKDLRAKYQAWQVDVSKVEEVDYVLDGSGLSAINVAQSFDWIIASHVIEHSPDFVRFLQDCSRLLKPSGVLSLAVPDKRYCFDYFQPLTSTGMVLDAYWSGRQRHSPGNMFDTYANHVSKGGAIAWSPTSGGKLATVHTFQEAKELTSRDATCDQYVDVHAWRFTPSSFALIVLDLINLDLTDLAPTDQAVSYGFEFFITLKKGFRPSPTPRLDLLSRIKSETDQV